MSSIRYEVGTLVALFKAVLTSLVLPAILLAACARQDGEKITVGGGPNVSMLVMIAQRNGYFADEHIKVDYKPLQTSKIAFDAVSAGQIDLGIVTDANIALLGYSGLGTVRILGSIMTKIDDAVLARSDHGITVPADLKGRRIGYTPASSGEVFLDFFMLRNHIAPADVHIVPMTAPTMSAALNHGDVDAVSVWQPFRYNIAKSLGTKGIEFENGGIYRAKILTICTTATAQSRSDQLKRFFRAVARAAQFAREHKAEAIALVEPDVGIDPTTLAATWDEYAFTVGDTANLAGNLRDIASALATTEPSLQSKPLPDYASYFNLAAQNEALRGIVSK